MKNQSKISQTRVCIIGGGAAGLSAGYYLKERGYQNITILEKEDRVGGKCLSLTVKGKSFDLGANYITSSYKNVMKLARIFGAKMYTEGKLRSYDNDSKTFSSLLQAVLRKTSFFKLGWLSLKFIWKRWRLNGIISTKNPGFKNISKHPDLCQPFENWLESNGLGELSTLFEVPISLMGYGQLKSIAAAYALTYMTVPTFLDLAVASISPKIMGYPKRFTEGYERLWDRISWELDVKVGATVTKVTRGDTITVEYSYLEELLGNQVASKQEIECDKLIIATPLYLDAIKPFLSDITEKETEYFGKVSYDPFIVTTYFAPGLEAFSAATFILPEPPLYHPFVVTRQFENNDLISIYTRTKYAEKICKETILDNNYSFIFEVTGVKLEHYYSYSEFPYFPHVDHDEMQNHFYTNLEEMQGKNNTFYVGGLMNFELVETIVNYSKFLIKNNFPRVNK